MSQKRVFKLWPEPQPGSGIPYGPTPKQKLLFIEDLPDPKPGMTEAELMWCRPHRHCLDVVLFIGAARCFDGETEILMYDGTSKKAKDIEIGDLLMGPDSLPRRVVELDSNLEFMYEITSDKGMTQKVSSEHLLSLKD